MIFQIKFNVSETFLSNYNSAFNQAVFWYYEKIAQTIIEKKPIGVSSMEIKKQCTLPNSFKRDMAKGAFAYFSKSEFFNIHVSNW